MFDSPIDTCQGVARLAAFIAFAVLVGTAFFTVFCWPAEPIGRPVRRMLAWSWLVLLGCTITLLVLHGPASAGLGLAEVTDSSLLQATMETRQGKAFAARIALLMVGLVALSHLLPRMAAGDEDQRRWAAAVVVIGTLALTTTWSFANHSSVGEQVAVSLPSDMVHLTAMGIWLGGLVVLASVALRSTDKDAIRQAVPRFSKTAQVCVGMLVATGIYQSWRELGSFSALLNTHYGNLLALKIGAVVLLLGVATGARSWVQQRYLPLGPGAATHRHRMRRSVSDRDLTRLRRMVGGEAAIAAVVLGLTTILINTQPAKAAELAESLEASSSAALSGDPDVLVGSQFSGPTVSRQFQFGPEARTGLLTIEVVPARVGANLVHIAVLDEAGLPISVLDMKTGVQSGARSTPVQVSPLQDGGHFAGQVTFTHSGEWELIVEFRPTTGDPVMNIAAPIEVK